MRIHFRSALQVLVAASLFLAGCAFDGTGDGGDGDGDGDGETTAASGGELRVGKFWFQGEVVELTYRQFGDLKIFEGDIILDPKSEIIEGPGQVSQTILSKGSAKLWNGSGNGGKGVVPFKIHSSITLPGRIKDAIAEWKNNTSIEFVNYDSTKHNSYVLFVNANVRADKYQNACWSSVGRLGGQQEIILDEDICKTGLVVHEIGHAVGLLHEHTRSDRDEYVRYFKDSTKAFYRPQYTKRTCANGGTQCDYERNGPYDAKSIMHYASTYFSNGTVNAIGTTWTLAKRKSDGSYSRIYNDGVLSAKDKDGVQLLYGFGTAPAPEPEPDPTPEPEPENPDEFPVDSWVTGTIKQDGSCMAGALSGTGVAMAQCNEDDLQQNWNMDDLRRLKNYETGLCARAASFFAGATVSQQTCSSSDLQKWRYLNMGIVNGKTGNCLQVASYEDGEQVTYEDCDAANSKQKFHHSPVTHQIFANAAQTMCLQAMSDGLVELQPCDSARASQKWHAGRGGFVNEGTATTDRCLAVAGGASSPTGSSIVVATCSDALGQQWGMRGNIRLYENSSYCLRAGGTAGSQPTVALCSASDELQKFTYWMSF